VVVVVVLYQMSEILAIVWGGSYLAGMVLLSSLQ
jgi:hypothetical protein